MDLDAVHALEAVGYRYQETTIVPWLDMSRWLAGHADPEVRPASEGDLERLCAIARATFRTDRFHNDPRFDSERADAVYEKWVRSWFAEQSESRFTRVLEHEGEVAGFVMYEVVDELELVNGPVCILVLGGADPALGVPGLGTRLWSALLDDAKERARYTSATMIASNSGVFNLYVKLGFRFTSTEVTLHRWYE